MELSKIVYDRYVAAAGNRAMDAFYHPVTGLAGFVVDDGVVKVRKWDNRLDDIGVAHPSDSELEDAAKAFAEMNAEPAVAADPDAELFKKFEGKGEAVREKRRRRKQRP